MPKIHRIVWPVAQIRQWIADGKTHAWIGQSLGHNPKLIYKVCKKHSIRCRRRGPREGVGHTGWKGGSIVDKDGYRLRYHPGHPHPRKKKYVLEHRLVMEAALGRFLLPKEVVHHKNGNKQDNRIENLELFAKNSDHLRHELTGRVPRWTPDGRRRILEAVRKRKKIRPASKPGA